MGPHLAEFLQGPHLSFMQMAPFGSIGTIGHHWAPLTPLGSMGTIPRYFCLKPTLEAI